MRLDRASILVARPAKSENFFLGWLFEEMTNIPLTLVVLPPAGRFFEKWQHLGKNTQIPLTLVVLPPAGRFFWKMFPVLHSLGARINMWWFFKKTTRRGQYHQSKLNLGLFFKMWSFFKKTTRRRQYHQRKGNIFSKDVFLFKEPTYLATCLCRLPRGLCRIPRGLCRLPRGLCRLPRGLCRLHGYLVHGYLIARLFDWNTVIC